MVVTIMMRKTKLMKLVTILKVDSTDECEDQFGDYKHTY
jgi:hypothetical protein